MQSYLICAPFAIMQSGDWTAPNGGSVRVTNSLFCRVQRAPDFVTDGWTFSRAADSHLGPAALSGWLRGAGLAGPRRSSVDASR